MRAGLLGIRAAVSRASVAVWLTAVTIGVMILWLPEPPKSPLIPAGAWQPDPLFLENVRPAEGDVSAGIRNHPDARFFRSWPPGSSVTQRSPTFTPPTYLAIPYAGYPSEQGMGLWLECTANGRRLPVARGNAHELWVERTMRLPQGWCRSRAQLVATSGPGQYYIAIGTPFTSSRMAWLKESVFVHVAVHALAVLLILGPGLLLLASRRVPREHHLLAAVSVTFAVGYLQFFVRYYAPGWAPAVVAAHGIAAVAGGVLAVRAIAHRRWPESVTTPLAFACLLSLAYVGVLYAGDVGAGTHDATYRFSPAVWSTDNQLAQMVTEALHQEQNLGKILYPWHVSDRPPLLTGVFLLLRPLWTPIVDHEDNARLLFYLYQIAGIVASTLWVVPVWVMLAGTSLSNRQRAAVLGLLATLGPMLFNSVYIWPKMLAGSLALMGCLVLAGHDEAPAGLKRQAMWAGLLMGLALMTHSGVAFTIPIAVLVILWWRPDQWSARAMLLGSVALIVLLPWMAWQRIEDPPGNALTKFAIAGTFGFDEQDVGVWDTVRTAYADVTLGAWWRKRVHGLGVVAGLQDASQEISWVYLRPMDRIGRLRLDDFTGLVYSFRAVNFGWIVLAGILLRRRIAQAVVTARAAAAWCAVGGAGVLFNVVAFWPVPITHHQSYLSLLLLATGLCVGVLLATGWWRRLIVAAHLAYFGALWIWSPLVHGRLAIGPALGATLAAALLVYLGSVEDHPVA